MDSQEHELTKSKKIVKVVAYSQLFVGLLFVFACFSGLMLPYLGIIKANSIEYKVNPIILPAYKDSFTLALDADYPEYKEPKTFWDKFATIIIYDAIIDKKEISFCIKRDYKLWGLSLGQLEKPLPLRYVIDSDGNLNRITEDINLGILCASNRVFDKTAE